MPGVLLRDHFPCEFDGESYYISEIDAARVEYPGDGDVVSIRIIPDNSLNNLKYGDTTLFLTFNDARLLAQAILSVAFEGVHVPPRIGTGRGWLPRAPLADAVAEPEPPDLLGAEPETGRLPADPRVIPGNNKDDDRLPIGWETYSSGSRDFTPMDTDALERVDAGGTEGIIKAMEGGLA